VSHDYPFWRLNRLLRVRLGVPLVLLVVAVGSLLGGDAIAERVLGAISDSLSASGRELLRETLTSGTGRTGATVVGVGVLAWSGLRVFRGLTMAFGTIYGIADEETFLGQLRRAGLALHALGIGVSTVVAGTVLLSESGIALAGLTAVSRRKPPYQGCG
jgi:membrane protein